MTDKLDPLHFGFEGAILDKYICAILQGGIDGCIVNVFDCAKKLLEQRQEYLKSKLKTEDE